MLFIVKGEFVGLFGNKCEWVVFVQQLKFVFWVYIGCSRVEVDVVFDQVVVEIGYQRVNVVGGIVFVFVVVEVVLYCFFVFEIMVFVDGVDIVFGWEVYFWMRQVEFVQRMVISEVIDFVVSGVYQYCV